MINNNDHNEKDLLKELIDDSYIEQPSADFAKNVMSGIYGLSEIQSVKWINRENVRSALSLAAIIIVSMGVSIYYFSSMVPEPGTDNPGQQVIALFNTIFAGLIPFVKSIQVSPITLIIIFSTLSLFLLDKILRKAMTGKTYFFSI